MTIKEAFNSVPKVILGPAIVLVGLFYFTIADPPKTVCDTQFEIFKNKTIKYVYEFKNNGITLKPTFLKDFDNCRTSNTPGACFDWLKGLKGLMRDIHFLPSECQSRMSELEPLGAHLKNSIWLFGHISWNDNPVVRKGILNWLDVEDMAVFCKTKKEIIRLYGDEYWKKIQEMTLQDLMRTKKIEDQKVNREEAWERSILSHSCIL